MTKLRFLSILLLTALLSGCDDIKALKEDIRALKEDADAVRVDLRLYKGFLMATAGFDECPRPGEHTTMICHHTLRIKGPYEVNKQKGWFVVTVPQEIAKEAKQDCEKLKDKNPDYATLPCLDTYQYREFVVYVHGDVKKDEVWHMVTDPSTDHLIAKEKVELPKI